MSLMSTDSVKRAMNGLPARTFHSKATDAAVELVRYPLRALRFDLIEKGKQTSI